MNEANNFQIAENPPLVIPDVSNCPFSIDLCDIDEVLPYINEDDAKVLADCNLFIDSDCDCLSMFA